MNRQIFTEDIIHRAGFWPRRFPVQSRRVLALTLKLWPRGERIASTHRAALESQLCIAVRNRYVAEYGFSPLMLMVLGAIINFLINWYFTDPSLHQELLEEVRAQPEHSLA